MVLERYPAYWRVGGDDIVVRIKDLPLLDAIRDLRTSHLNCFIKVSGVVTRRSQVRRSQHGKVAGRVAGAACVPVISAAKLINTRCRCTPS